MSALRIFVSYALTEDEQGTTVARQFINDLRAHGAEVITDQPTITEDDFVKYLNTELPRCQYLILIQTPKAQEAQRVQNTVNVALQMITQQRMKGILHLIAVPVHATDENEQPLWISPHAFDATRDYPRAREQMLLELDLLKLDEDDQDSIDQTIPSSPLNSTARLAPGPSSALIDLTLYDKTLVDTLPLPVVLSGQKRMLRDNHSSQRKTSWLSLTIMALILILGATVGVITLRSPNHGLGIPISPTHVSGTATRQATKQPTTTLVSTATITIGSVKVATPTPVSVALVDDIDNWGKTISHTSNLDLDQNNSAHMHGDTSLAIRTNAKAASVVWKLNGMTSFRAVTYFWPPQDKAPLSDLQTYTSADGVHWNATTPTLFSELSSDGDIWSIYTYTLSNLSNVNYVKMSWSATSDESWGQQIGQVTMQG